LHEIEWKNNGFLFTTPNIMQHNGSTNFDNDDFNCRQIVGKLLFKVQIIKLPTNENSVAAILVATYA